LGIKGKGRSPDNGEIISKRSTQKLDEEYTEKLDKLNGLHMNRRIKS
jgi:hypothetical protein